MTKRDDGRYKFILRIKGDITKFREEITTVTTPKS